MAGALAGALLAVGHPVPHGRGDGHHGRHLTHHLNALEKQGLVRRWREADNRRVQQVALTAAGEALFARLREVAMRHDRRLRSNLTDKETALLAELLDKLRAGIDQLA